jgi:phage N-6-adenine-methyltransferase
MKAAPIHYLKEVGDQWCTPDALFSGINAMYGPLVLDLFADQGNAKCHDFYTAEDNALVQNWSSRLAQLHGAAFANPPYSIAKKHENQFITGMRYIMKHTAAMRELGGRYVFLIKAATSETWWPEYADHISFIRGRIGFDVPIWYRPADKSQVPTSAFFAGAIAIFDKTWNGPAMGYINRDELLARGKVASAPVSLIAPRMKNQQNSFVNYQI